jgi:hypothetical protein
MARLDMSPKFSDLEAPYVLDPEQLAADAEAIRAAAIETDAATLLRNKPEAIANMALAGVQVETSMYASEPNQGGEL